MNGKHDGTCHHSSGVGRRNRLFVFALIVLGCILAPLVIYQIQKRNTLSLVRTRSKILKLRNQETATKQRHLPSLEHGGIVFYLHLPKTGGSTIRTQLKYQKGRRRSRIHYIYLTSLKEYQDTAKIMNEWLENGTTGVVYTKRKNKQPIGKVVFIEFHPLHRDCPTFLQVSKTVLPDWKQQAKAKNIPFFSFATWREPISMAVSFFNFYHGIPQNPKRFDLLIPTADKGAESKHVDFLNIEEVFKEATIANPQCLFLTHNEDAYTKTGQDLRDSFTWEECQQSYSNMLSLMDWIGVTDKLSNETLPLLKHLFSTNNLTQDLISNVHKVSNHATTEQAPIHEDTLRPQTVTFLQSMAKWDQQVHDVIQQHYSFNQWMFESRQ